MNKIYFNGDILTMDDNHYESVYVENDIIKRCGDYKQLIAEIPSDTIHVDLQGKCLMPSFIDSHSHLVAFASTLKLVNLSKATSIKDIINSFKKHIKTNNYSKNEMIIGFGYDHNFLKEKRHPTASELDNISATNPIMISHASGHMGVINTKAIELLGLNDQVSDPVGGKYGRDENGHLNGYLEEQAFISNSNKGGANIDLKNQILDALKIYASYGITTVQEGFMKDNEYQLLNALSKDHKLFLDVVGYVDIKDHRHIYQENKQYHQYLNNFKLGGYKMFLDGSPQGKTAWLSKPYENSGDYCGYPIYQDNEVNSFVRTALNDNAQLLTHCNGDAASNQLLNAFNDEFTELRPVMIHSQTLRPDQLPRLKRIGMIPSFFIGHVYYWGDIHLQNLGSRANKISCVNSASKIDLPYTFHQDTPVIPPNMLESVWCAVKRKTKNGVILGADERITVYDALKAVTINGAYQYFEENSKGTIKEGKKADLIILDNNPCKVDIDEIKNIKIIETIKDGKTVYHNT